MSKTEILQELPKLNAAERLEIFERICEMEETALLNGAQPSAQEKEMLDRELEAYRAKPGSGFFLAGSRGAVTKIRRVIRPDSIQPFQG